MNYEKNGDEVIDKILDHIEKGKMEITRKKNMRARSLLANAITRILEREDKLRSLIKKVIESDNLKSLETIDNRDYAKRKRRNYEGRN